jgi:hypothetical protein
MTEILVLDQKDTIPKRIKLLEMETDTLGILYLLVHTYTKVWNVHPGTFDILKKIKSSLGAFYHDYSN